VRSLREVKWQTRQQQALESAPGDVDHQLRQNFSLLLLIVWPSRKVDNKKPENRRWHDYVDTGVNNIWMHKAMREIVAAIRGYVASLGRYPWSNTITGGALRPLLLQNPRQC